MAHSMRAVHRVEAAAAGVVLAMLVLGLTVRLLLAPVSVRTLVLAAGSSRASALSEEQTLEAAESVRRFVTDGDAPPLPRAINGAPAFDEAAIAHLTDVRRVILLARRLTAGLLVTSLAWAGLRSRAPSGREALARACRFASGCLSVAVVFSGTLAALDFDTFFARFHQLFFEEGTWLFPAGDLLVRLFPERFWILAGASWAVLIAVAAALLWCLGGRMVSRLGTYGV